METLLNKLLMAIQNIDVGTVLIKLAAIGAMCWLLYLVFDYTERTMRSFKKKPPVRRDDDDNFPPDATQLGI